MENKNLLDKLKDTVEFFSERKSVGRMKTEHVIFVPVKLITNSQKETADFIKTAKYINKVEAFYCNVSAEKVIRADVQGIEFVFEFTDNTDFDSIIEEINKRIEDADG